jgi:hypothetical protein
MRCILRNISKPLPAILVYTYTQKKPANFLINRNLYVLIAARIQDNTYIQAILNY